MALPSARNSESSERTGTAGGKGERQQSIGRQNQTRGKSHLDRLRERSDSSLQEREIKSTFSIVYIVYTLHLYTMLDSRLDTTPVATAVVLNRSHA